MSAPLEHPEPDEALAPPLDGMLDDVADTVVAPLPRLQLRVLSGLHAGARVALDGDAYLLGAQDDCDFVLADAGIQPHHARLSRVEGAGGDGWELHWLAPAGEDTALAPMRLDRAKAVPLGPVVVAVDNADAAWPTLEQLVLVPHAPALEPRLPPPQVALKLPDPQRWSGWLGAASRRRALVGVAAATLCLSAAALVAWPIRLGQGGSPGTGVAALEPPAAAPVPAPDASQRAAIESILAGRGLAGRARIEPAGAAWQVRAPVMSDLDGEALMAALSRLQPRPVLRLPTEQELTEEVSEALPRLAAGHAAGVRLRPLGAGRFRLEGRMPSAAQRDQLLRAAAEAFPQAAWEHAVQTPQEAGAQLLGDLRQRGWQASGEWKDDAMQVQVTLQQRDVPNWEQTLLAADRVHGVPLRASLLFAQTAPTPSPAPRAGEARLPFQVRGVVGGDMPYVVLAGGDRLSQGGVWQGWRLASITGGQLVFENGAQRAVVTR